MTLLAALAGATGACTPKHGGQAAAQPKCQYIVNRVFSVAGVWITWRSDGEEVESFALITTEPNETVAPIHGRMPAILGPGAVDAWLDPEFGGRGALRHMLAPWAGDPLECWEVGLAVNRRGAEGPERIEPVRRLL